MTKRFAILLYDRTSTCVEHCCKACNWKLIEENTQHEGEIEQKWEYSL